MADERTIERLRAAVEQARAEAAVLQAKAGALVAELDAVLTSVGDPGAHQSQPEPVPAPEPRAATGRTRVLIADDDKVFRELLTVVIEAEGSLELVGAAADAQEAIDLARRDPPDVAVLDLNMPGGFGTRAAREIRALAPATQILALTALDSADARLEIQRAGATGFVVKGASPAEILEAIRAIAKPT